MRKTLFPIVVLLLALPLQAGGPASYAGSWALDKAQSKDLPPWYSEVTSHSLKISQDAKQLVVNAEIAAVGRDADQFNFTYTLDGKPVASETQIRTPGGPMSVPTTLTAKPQENGDLLITIERQLPSRGGGEPMKGTTVETWRLSADGKTLTIDRVDEMPRGKFSSVLVFTKS